MMRSVSANGLFPLTESGVLRLQRLAGNRAVSQLLASHADASTQVQRYEAGEHAQFGAKAGKKERTFHMNGVKVSYGELIAMGDFFESPAEMKDFANQNAKAFENLVELIRKDRKAFEAQAASAVTGKEPPGAVSQKEWQDATAMLPKGKQYLDVTGRNVTHFAGKNQETWISFHKQALDLARAGKTEEALITNALADHFLTDAFSAGHMFDKAAAMARAKAAVDAQIGKWTLSTAWTDAVAKGILADATASSKLNNFQIKTWGLTSDWYDMNDSSLSKVIFGIYQDPTAQEKVLGLFANFVHNSLNAEIAHGDGVAVKNKYGTEWKHGLAGDDTLAKSPETLAIAREAVARSRQNVLDAAKSKHALDYQAMIDRVWDFVPVATDKGEKTINEAIARYANPDDPKTIAAFIDVSVENIDLTVDELLKRGYLRHKSDAEVVTKQAVTDVAKWTTEEKIRVINNLLSGWIKDKDVDAVVEILNSVYSEEGRSETDVYNDLNKIRDGTSDRVDGMHTKKQKERVRAALTWDPAKLKVPAGAR